MKGRIQHTAIWTAILFFVIGGAVAWKIKPAHQWKMYYADPDYYQEPWYPMMSKDAFMEKVAEFCGYKAVLVNSYFEQDEDCPSGGMLTINANYVLVYGSTFIHTAVEIREEPDLDWIRAEDDPLIY
jgi:hypothetical protein